MNKKKDRLERPLPEETTTLDRKIFPKESWLSNDMPSLCKEELANIWGYLMLNLAEDKA